MSDELRRGTRIAGFVLEEPLGRGGFGVTYRARAERTGQVYAIKEYFPAEFARRDRQGHVVAAEGPQAARLFDLGRAAFLDEAYILRDLPRQPGLVRVRSAFQKHNTAYCVTDFIDGDTLDRVAGPITARGEVLPQPMLVQLAATLCRALGAVHRAGFIHRDIKPANVMIDRSGAPVLIDFGAARAHGGGQTVASMLSRRYAALEQFPSARALGLRQGPWSDLYALSVMLYELMARALPDTAEARHARVLAGQGDPYLRVAEAVVRNRTEARYGAALTDLVDHGCALMPDDRPRSAEEYARRLGGEDEAPTVFTPLARTVAAAMPRRPSSVPQPASQPVSRGVRSERGKPVAMLALILCVALLAALAGHLNWFGW